MEEIYTDWVLCMLHRYILPPLAYTCIMIYGMGTCKLVPSLGLSALTAHHIFFVAGVDADADAVKHPAIVSWQLAAKSLGLRSTCAQGLAQLCPYSSFPCKQSWNSFYCQQIIGCISCWEEGGELTVFRLLRVSRFTDEALTNHLTDDIHLLTPRPGYTGGPWGACVTSCVTVL